MNHRPDPHPSPRTDEGLPLFITAYPDVVTVMRADLKSPLLLTGRGAHIVIEVIRRGRPTHWVDLAEAVWPPTDSLSGEDYEAVVRCRWDAACHRLRVRLNAARIRPNLVHRIGGFVHLDVVAADTVVDESRSRAPCLLVSKSDRSNFPFWNYNA